MSERHSAPTMPTASLGELLIANRCDAGLTLDEVGQTSGLGRDRVAAVEAGRHDLSDAELSILLDRYPIPSASRRFTRTVVEIDLDGGSLRLRKTRRHRSVPSADRNLLQYLALVHHHFEIEPGTPLPLKAVDLVLLRASLALRRDQVTSRLDRMTGGGRAHLVRHRSLLAAAVATGVVVAAGAIVLIPSASEPEPSGGDIDPRIDIGVPLVVERDASEIPGPGPIVETPVGETGAVLERGTAPADQDPAVDAADAAVTVERPDDPSPTRRNGPIDGPDPGAPTPPPTLDGPRSRGPPTSIS